MISWNPKRFSFNLLVQFDLVCHLYIRCFFLNWLPVVNSLYLLWRVFLSTVDFDTDAPTAWMVFFMWPTAVDGFFLSREITLLSLCTVIFWPFWCYFFIDQQNKYLIWPHLVLFAVSLMSWLWFYNLLITSFMCNHNSSNELQTGSLVTSFRSESIKTETC